MYRNNKLQKQQGNAPMIIAVCSPEVSDLQVDAEKPWQTPFLFHCQSSYASPTLVGKIIVLFLFLLPNLAHGN